MVRSVDGKQAILEPHLKGQAWLLETHHRNLEIVTRKLTGWPVLHDLSRTLEMAAVRVVIAAQGADGERHTAPLELST